MLFPFHDDVPTRRLPLVTIALIVMNTVVFLWSLGLPELQEEILAYRWGFVPARVRQLGDPRPLAIRLEREEGAGWFWGPVPRRLVLRADAGLLALSLVTYMFLHGSWLHLLGNMWYLWIFGDNVEDRLGHAGFLLFYLLGGVLAGLAHWLSYPTSTMPVIGASGAVATILGAYAVTWPWARVRSLVFLFIFVTVVELPALLVLGVWFVYQLLAGLQSGPGVGQGVAWWAHVGGFVAGLVLMPMWSAVLGVAPRPRRVETRSETDVGPPRDPDRGLGW